VVRERNKQALIDLKLSVLEEFTKESKDVQVHLEQLNHDYRFHLQVIKNMLDNDLHKEAEDYYEEITEHYSDVKAYYIEDYSALSVLFMQMAGKAREEGVDFRCRIPKRLEFVGRESEISAILSNLMENAFRAVNHLVHRKWICVEMGNMHDNLMIIVENPVEEGVKGKGADSEGRGIGLKSVERMVKDYQGIMDVEEKGKVFSVSILIPNEVGVGKVI
jgi:sensor histidine kinase regulating citrate/malate metabolism